MGMFMSSVAFRCSDKALWKRIKPEIEQMARVDGLVDNLDTEDMSHCIVSPYGEMGEYLAELPEKISALTGDYAVVATCVDSDFCMLALFNKGTLVEECCIGEVYEEYADFCETKAPCIDNWKPLLLIEAETERLNDALFGEEVFVEDHLRALSELTGLPIFDDELVFGDI